MQDVCQAALQNIIGFIVQKVTNFAYWLLYCSGRLEIIVSITPKFHSLFSVRSTQNSLK